MASNKQIAVNAIKNAFIELHLGKKQAARALALGALKLAPELEDPWLILAAVAEPRASLEYLKEALKINPGSFRARHGLLEVQRRLEKTSKIAIPPAARQDSFETQQQVEEPARRPIPFANRPDFMDTRPRYKKSSPSALPQASKVVPKKVIRPSRWSWFGLISFFGVGVIAILALSVVTSQNGSVNARGLSTSERESIVLQQMATSTATVTETPKPTEPAPATPLPTDTAIPTATQPEPTAPPSATPAPAPTQPVASVSFNAQVLPAPPDSSGGKSIFVYISQQHLYAYQGSTLVYSFVVSTGANNATRIGTFSILDKIPNAWSDPWGFWMPDWLGIYWIGDTENGIHSLPILTNGNVIWGDGLGTPISHGCVVLSSQDAHLLFTWADVGTQVQILR